MIDTKKREFFAKVSAVLAIPLVASDVFLIGPDGQRSVVRSGKVLWFIDVARVNIEDVVNARPGSIIRCKGNPSECLKVYQIE